MVPISPHDKYASSQRTAVLLDAARVILAAALQTGSAGSGSTDNLVAAAERARGRLVWAGQWLDEPYVPGPIEPVPPLTTAQVIERVRKLADSLEALVESFEQEDPIANANGVQAGSLAYAVASATAAYFERALSSASHCSPLPQVLHSNQRVDTTDEGATRGGPHHDARSGPGI
jgi:hypothetical protein